MHIQSNFEDGEDITCFGLSLSKNVLKENCCLVEASFESKVGKKRVFLKIVIGRFISFSLIQLSAYEGSVYYNIS